MQALMAVGQSIFLLHGQRVYLIPFNSTQVTTANIATTYDIFPTSLALAGYPLPDDRIYDGQDLSDVGELIEPHIMGRLDVNYRYYIL